MEEQINIPSNLEECFKELDNIFNESPDDKLQFVSGDEESATVSLHHGLGRWIRNNWGLWSGGSLKNFFINKGIEHADDMSGIILTSYHRHLNKKDLNLEEQINFYKNFWKEKSDPI